MNPHPILWLIPARGGSKGIPGKNLKPFCGIPLAERAVKQALLCAKENDVVFVSTDSEDIKELSERAGVEVPFLRPAELATDQASSYDVMVNAVEEFNKRGYKFNTLVLLQPTSPLRSIQDIEGAVKKWTPEIDMVVSVCQSDANPYYNLFETDSKGFLKICKGNGNFSRRQDLPEVWQYNGAVYVISVESLLKSPLSGFKKIVPFEMPAERSVDLDTPHDWLVAESMASLNP